MYHCRMESWDLLAGSLLKENRLKAGLTQRALAKKAGTTASVIRQMEEADYDGNSLPTLQRIAAALGKRVEIRFVSATKPKRPKVRRVA